MAKDWKDRLGVVFSTNPDYDYDKGEEEEQESLQPEKQNLRVTIDRKKRKGKAVTLITGFIGNEEDMKSLAKELKIKCGVGGSAKEGEIIIQGEFKDRIIDLLKSMGYKAK